MLLEYIEAEEDEQAGRRQGVVENTLWVSVATTTTQ